jgi:hypothetical protein
MRLIFSATSSEAILRNLAADPALPCDHVVNHSRPVPLWGGREGRSPLRFRDYFEGLDRFNFWRRTAGPPPFSSMNSMPTFYGAPL